jgi:hypothetical protein
MAAPLDLALLEARFPDRMRWVEGAVFDARKQQYSVGTAILIDWSPGDLYYSALAAKQKALAAEQLAEKSRRDI